MKFNIDQLAWDKMQGLIPLIVQDAKTQNVLMLGYMNQAALNQTLATGFVCFFSRSKNRLWTKGELSGNKLELVNIFADCDNDSLLIHANPFGPICHMGSDNCFSTSQTHPWSFIETLEARIYARQQAANSDSYTVKLLNSGLNRIAQKVGEEGVEVALAAVTQTDDELCNEMADLFYHLLVLLRARNLEINDVINVLINRS